MAVHRVPRAVRLLSVAAALGAMTFAAAVAAGQGGETWAQISLLAGTLLASAAACAVRAAAVPEDRLAWWLMAAAMATWAAAELVNGIWIQHMDPVPYPSLADALWLADYPLSAVAVVLLLRRGAGRIPFAFWLDGAIGAVTLLALTTIAVAHLPTSGASQVEVLVNLAYPTGDLLLCVLLAGALASGSFRLSAGWLLIAASFAAQVLSDGSYLEEVAAGTYRAGTVADLGWYLAPAALALAAARGLGTMRAAQRPARWHALVCGAGCGVVAALLLIADHWIRLPSGTVALAGLAVLLLMVRLAVVFRDNERLLRRARDDARTDALTGLGNRRGLLADLEDAVGRSGVLALYDLDGFKAYNDTYGHPAGDELLRRLGARLAESAAIDGAHAYRLGGDEFCLLADCEPAAVDRIALRGQIALAEAGEGFAVSASAGWSRLPVVGGAPAALAEADQRMYAAKHGGRPTAARQAARALMAAVSERHPDLGDHVGEVAVLARAVALRMRLDEATVEAVSEAAELHDVGKIAIPDAILTKPGPLDEAEWRFMRRHTLIGERILNAAPDLARVAGLVRASHERWDGRGYPDGLAGAAIPVGARIVTVCDAYDAMVADRPYRPARTSEQALRELRRCAGTQFDPEVVEAFAATLAAVAAVA